MRLTAKRLLSAALTRLATASSSPQEPMGTSLSSLPNTVMPTFWRANLPPTAEITPTVRAFSTAFAVSGAATPAIPAHPPRTSSSKATTTLRCITPPYASAPHLSCHGGVGVAM